MNLFFIKFIPLPRYYAVLPITCFSEKTERKKIGPQTATFAEDVAVAL